MNRDDRSNFTFSLRIGSVDLPTVQNRKHKKRDSISEKQRGPRLDVRRAESDLERREGAVSCTDDGRRKE